MTNDLLSEIKEIRETVDKATRNRKVLTYDERDRIFNLLSDLQTLPVLRSLGEGGFENPPEQVKGALENVNTHIALARMSYPNYAFPPTIESLQTIRTALLSLTAQVAERDKEIKRLRGTKNDAE